MSSVDSPCVNVCMMKAGLCTGCHRTLDEIAGWYEMSDTQKREVVAAAEQRGIAARRRRQAQTAQQQ